MDRDISAIPGVILENFFEGCWYTFFQSYLRVGPSDDEFMSSHMPSVFANMAPRHGSEFYTRLRHGLEQTRNHECLRRLVDFWPRVIAGSVEPVEAAARVKPSTVAASAKGEPPTPETRQRETHV